MFCKHEWEILSEITTKSKFESSMHAAHKNDLSNFNLPSQLCDADRLIIQIVVCNKCGKLKRFVTNI